jgi:hypothetical protein
VRANVTGVPLATKLAKSLILFVTSVTNVTNVQAFFAPHILHTRPRQSLGGVQMG